MKTSKEQIYKIIAAVCTCVLTIAAVLLTSCGSTKVAVSKPAEGTSTTITVTTNNPISTNVNPTTNLNQK